MGGRLWCGGGVAYLRVMRGFLLRWLVSALALYLTAGLLSGIELNGVMSILGGALAIGIVNALFRPILFLLTLPLTIVTFGLFALVMNALLLWFASSSCPDSTSPASGRRSSGPCSSPSSPFSSPC
jgi:putative membrane protein